MTSTPGGATERVAPESCPHCFDETDCSNIDVCNAAADQSPAPPSDDVRSALKTALEEIVLVIAFLSRDLGSERLTGTIMSLIARLTRADLSIRAALRSAPVSAPVLDAEISRWENDSRVLYPDNEVLESLSRIKAASAPAVGATREAIAREIADSMYPAFDWSKADFTKPATAAMKAMLKAADAILALRSPVPDATVSPTQEQIAQAIYETGMELENDAATWAYAKRIAETYKAKDGFAAEHAEMYQQEIDAAIAQAQSVLALNSSPQHVGRDAAVSDEERAMRRATLLLDEAYSSAPRFKAAHNSGESDPSVMPDCRGAETPVSARDAVIEALQLGIHWAQQGGKDAEGLTKIAACNAVKIINDAIRSLTGAKP